MYLGKIERKFSVKTDGELKEILSLCKHEPVFFGNEKKLLSIDEILNGREELKFKDSRIISIIDLWDNNFLSYDIKNKQFVRFNIMDEVKYGKIDSIKIYIDELKNL